MVGRFREVLLYIQYRTDFTQQTEFQDVWHYYSMCYANNWNPFMLFSYQYFSHYIDTSCPTSSDHSTVLLARHVCTLYIYIYIYIHICMYIYIYCIDICIHELTKSTPAPRSIVIGSVRQTIMLFVSLLMTESQRGGNKSPRINVVTLVSALGTFSYSPERAPPVKHTRTHKPKTN